MSENKIVYPPLTFDSVYNVQQALDLMARYPKFLDNAPYDTIVKSALTKLESNRASLLTSLTDVSLENISLEAEIVQIYLDMKQLKIEGLEPNEKLNLGKTKSTLMEKLLDMAEKSANIRHVQEFQRKILDIISTLDPEVKQKFLQALGETDDK